MFFGEICKNYLLVKFLYNLIIFDDFSKTYTPEIANFEEAAFRGL